MAVKCPKCQTKYPEDSNFCKECATPLPSPVYLSVTKTLETPAKGLVLGSTFAGRYQIVEELGKGGLVNIVSYCQKKEAETNMLKHKPIHHLSTISQNNKLNTKNLEIKRRPQL